MMVFNVCANKTVQLYWYLLPYGRPVMMSFDLSCGSHRYCDYGWLSVYYNAIKQILILQ